MMANNQHKPINGLRARLGNRDSILGLSIFAFCLCLLLFLIPQQVKNPNIPGTFIKPDFFPYAITLLLTLLSLLLVFFGYKTSRDSSRSDDKRITKSTVICVTILGVALSAIKWVGMAPMSLVTMYVLMNLFGFKNKKIAVLISLGFTVVLFLFFDKVATVSIPRGTLFENLY